MNANQKRTSGKHTTAVPSSKSRSNGWVTVAVIAYVVAVLLVDTLAISGLKWPFAWSSFYWMLGDRVVFFGNTVFGRFDLFKFVFWLVLPICFCARSLDLRYLVRGRWTRWDGGFVAGLAVLGMAAILLIPLVPELRKFYPSLGQWPVSARVRFFEVQLVWTLSWIVGWEFLHRYFLLRAVQSAPPDWRRWREPRQWGWLLVPVSETVYHLQKASLEAVGMCILSILLTLWCLKRGNWLIAFLVHFVIEVELLLFLTVVT